MHGMHRNFKKNYLPKFFEPVYFFKWTRMSVTRTAADYGSFKKNHLHTVLRAMVIFLSG